VRRQLASVTDRNIVSGKVKVSYSKLGIYRKVKVVMMKTDVNNK
jgi:hypothetical protein